MKILKIIVDEIPHCCADCPGLGLRTDEDLWPHCCGFTDGDVLETEGPRPEFCPLIEESEEE